MYINWWIIRNCVSNMPILSCILWPANVKSHLSRQVVCEATQSFNTQIKVAALQCLVKVMSLYYQYMEHYMGPALFAVSIMWFTIWDTLLCSISIKGGGGSL